MTVTSQDLLDRYLDECRQRGLAKSTIWSKFHILNKIERELGLMTAKPEDIGAWLDQDIQSSSKVMYLQVIHSFYEWCMENDTIKRNPSNRVPRPKVKRGHPDPIKPYDLTLALARADQAMKAWLLLGAAAGLRCIEICHLEARDIHIEDVEAPWIQVRRGKGGKDRTVPMHVELERALIVLKWPQKGGRMWPTLTPQSLSQRINYHLRMSGSKATAHKLRHYAATNYWKALNDAGTPDILLLTDFLGHSSPATSLIYTRRDVRKGTAAMQFMTIGMTAESVPQDSTDPQ